MLRLTAFTWLILTACSTCGAEEPATPKEKAVRTVVQAVAQQAVELQKLPLKERPSGDALTEAYIRTAATAANKLDKSVRVAGFVIGLGIALDDSNTLSGNPLTKKLCASAENADERKARIKNLGSPTVHARRDLCQHFAVSAALTEIVGADLAEFVGVAKEQADKLGGSGFSFADLCVDLAGIEFAKRIQKEPAVLEKLAKDYKVVDWVPGIEGLREGLKEAAFQKDFGGATDKRYQDQLSELRKRVAAVKGAKGS